MIKGVRPSVFFQSRFFALITLFTIMTAGAANGQGTSNPFGFEDGTIGAWTAGGSSESVSVNSTAVNTRTGSYSLKWTTTSTSSNKYAYSNTPYGTSASGTYIHFIYWALAQDPSTTVDASLRYGSSAPPSGTGSTANASGGYGLSTTAWTRVVFNLTYGSSGRYYFAAPRKTSGNATTYYLDDGIIYLSNNSTTDTVDPGAATALAATAAGTTVNLSWTSNTDANTGVQATIVLRTSNTAAAAPDLNDQAIYSTTGGNAGPNTVGSWTIISTTTGATATTYADNSVPGGTYKYAVILRDLAYNYSTAVVSPSVTVGGGSPSITVNQTGFTGTFGNVVTGSNSAAQQYSVTGSNLTNDIIVTAPSGFQVSTSSSTGFTSSLTLTQTAGAVAATPVYVRYSPTAATGATGTLTVTNASTGATTQNVSVSGNALATEPTTNGTISFGTITNTSIVVNLPTVGNGSNRIIVARAASAVTFTPTDAVASTGVNSDFSVAANQGSGNEIIYDGAGSGSSVVTVTGLTAGTTYYFTVYEYNVGTGTSQNYLLSPAATGNTITTVPAPVVTLTTTGFTGIFGNVVTGTNSATQQYSVTGANLTADITVTAPSGFQVSANSTTGFASFLTLTQTAGTVTSTPVFVRYSPTTATGATGTLTVTNASTGATTQNVSVSGNALATEPATNGTISFGTVTNTSIVINLPTVGNGSRRIIVAKAAGAVTFTPTDGVAVTGVNSDFSLATNQGSGNEIVYDGTGSGSSVVTVTNLAIGTTYYFTVYEYNVGTGTSQNYLLTPAATGSTTTTSPSPLIAINQTGFTGTFGNVVTGTNSATQQYNVSGSNLTTDITIAAPAGFQVSTNSSTGFAATLTLTQSGGAVASTPVYVRYSPTAATGATGTLSITHASTGATTQNVSVSGNALATEPATNGTISFGTVTNTSIVINLPTVGNGSRRIIVAKAAGAVTFTPTDGVAVTGVNSDFSLATNQGSGNEIVYDGTGSGSSVVTVTNLAIGTTYYFTVYEYNVGTGTSQNYLLTPVATGSTTTTVPPPVITATTTGFTGTFGNVVTGANSVTQQYTVSGIYLTANLTVTAPSGFQVSTSSSTGFGTSVSLTPASGAVASTAIYVRYSPTAATGATGTLTVTNASAGATTQNVSVSGNALAAEPTTSGTISFGTVTTTSMVVNLPTIGNGSKRIIVARASSTVNFTPTDAVASTGVNSDFSIATNQGNNNKIVYDGSGSGSGVVTVTGLTSGTTYYFTVYEYNAGTGTSQNYLLSPAATGSVATSVPPPVITVTTTGFTGNFGNVVTGTNSTTQQYTVSGVYLTANLIITAPAGFQVSTSSSSGFGTSVSLAPSGGTVASTTIYVRYSPTAAGGATGTLTVTNASTGAATQSVSVSGNALATEPTTSGTISFGTITTNSIVVNLPTIGNGSKRIIVARPASAVNFTPADAVASTGVNSDFTLAANQGNGNEIVYDGTGSGNNVVTVSGLTPGTTYYFTVYEYNVGTGTSQNYLLTPAAAGNAVTMLPTPTITLSASGFPGNFGNVTMGTFSTEQVYTVSGANLTNNIVITAPTDFQISLTTGTGFGSTLTLTPATGTVAATAIYVRYAPATATGATGTLTITNTSTGAVTQNVFLNGNALAVAPTASGTISFGQVTDTSIEVNLPTVGDGSKRIIVMKQGSVTTFIPADGTTVTGVNSDFNLAVDQGNANKVIYEGSGSGNSVVTVTGLTAATLYYFMVYEYNEGTGTSQHYLINPAANSDMTTSYPAGMNNTQIAKDISVYPNPAQNIVHIKAPVAVNIIIRDMTGRTVYSATNVADMDLGNLPEGVYSAIILNAEGRILKTEKLLKTK
ncbi:T9SS type A sorting domain-containing protein [Chitinophagaceae bacterium MMS25-I14]